MKLWLRESEWLCVRSVSKWNRLGWVVAERREKKSRKKSSALYAGGAEFALLPDEAVLAAGWL